MSAAVADELVARLEARRVSIYDMTTQGAEWHDDDLCQEAAAEITRLQAALTACREERDTAYERAAKVADKLHTDPRHSEWQYATACSDIATAIRALKESSNG